MNQDFVDLLRAFVAHDVRFLVVGAYALGVHGRPRATDDLDVWIDATPSNAGRVMEARDRTGQGPGRRRVPRRPALTRSRRGARGGPRRTTSE